MQTSMTLGKGASTLHYPDLISPPPVADTSPEIIRSYPLHFESPEDIMAPLRALFPAAKLSYNSRQRIITAKASATTHKHIKQVLSTWDDPLYLFQFNIHLFEITYSNTHERDLFFSSLGEAVDIEVSLTEASLLSPTSVKGFFHFLNNYANTKLVARPTITVLENNVALIELGENIPYVTSVISDQTLSIQAQQVQTGIQVELVPRMTMDNLVEVDIKNKVSSVKFWKQLGDIEYPVLSSRTTHTSVSIPLNSTLVISGLTDESENVVENRLPILSRLPLIGFLFKTTSNEKSNSEIIFTLTPSLVEKTKE